jgi:hypothetical protein
VFILFWLHVIIRSLVMFGGQPDWGVGAAGLWRAVDRLNNGAWFADRRRAVLYLGVQSLAIGLILIPRSSIIFRCSLPLFPAVELLGGVSASCGSQPSC